MYLLYKFSKKIGPAKILCDYVVTLAYTHTPSAHVTTLTYTYNYEVYNLLL